MSLLKASESVGEEAWPDPKKNAAELSQAHTRLAHVRGNSKGKGKYRYPARPFYAPICIGPSGKACGPQKENDMQVFRKARTWVRRPGMPSEEGRCVELRIGYEKGTHVAHLRFGGAACDEDRLPLHQG